MNDSFLTEGRLNYSLADCGNAFLFGVLEKFGYLFYIVSPSESAKESPHQVINYEVAVFPAIAILIGLEQFYKFATRKKNNKLNDIIINLGAGLLFLVLR